MLTVYISCCRYLANPLACCNFATAELQPIDIGQEEALTDSFSNNDSPLVNINLLSCNVMLVWLYNVIRGKRERFSKHIEALTYLTNENI